MLDTYTDAQNWGFYMIVQGCIFIDAFILDMYKICMCVAKRKMVLVLEGLINWTMTLGNHEDGTKHDVNIQ